MKIMVSVLVVVIFCTLLYCVYCWRWRKRNGQLLLSSSSSASLDPLLMDRIEFGWMIQL